MRERQTEDGHDRVADELVEHCLGIVAVLVVLPFLTRALPWVVPVLALVVHTGWAVQRWNNWKEFHEHERRTALGGASGHPGGAW